MVSGYIPGSGKKRKKGLVVAIKYFRQIKENARMLVFNSFQFIELFVVGGANKRQAESGSCNNTIFLDSTLFLVYSKNNFNPILIVNYAYFRLLLVSGILQAFRQYDNIFIGAESDHCIDLRSN